MQARGGDCEGKGVRQGMRERNEKVWSSWTRPVIKFSRRLFQRSDELFLMSYRVVREESREGKGMCALARLPLANTSDAFMPLDVWVA